MVRIAWIGLVLWPVLVAPSKVYRCEAGGQITYTDHACEAGALPADLPAIGTMPGMKGLDLAKDFDARTKREREAHDKAERAWSEAYTKQKQVQAKAEAERRAERAARRKAEREGYTMKSPTPAQSPKK
jgi:hypothetical protein